MLRRVEKPIGLVHSWVKIILPIFIVAGVVLSCMHQSSLGTLMVIAPTKVSTLWYTPFLPVLFLLSAMMVGLPMVIIESIIAGKSFGHEPDRDLIGPLAKIVPWQIGIYAVFKFGDLILRWKQLNFTQHPDATVAWSVEIIFGIITPFVLLSIKTVRRSKGWLLTSSLLVVLYSLVHAQAIQVSLRAATDLQVINIPKKPTIDTSTFRHAERPDAYRNLYVLNSAVLNERIDYHEPVRFTHRTHDVNTDSNCSICHHRFAMGPDDRVGEDVNKIHDSIEIRITGASCTSCHQDLNEKKFQKCSQCHSSSNESDFPARIGLKGAYHRQCIGCHQVQPKTANAPTDCASCHHPLVPDHKPLLNVQAGAVKFEDALWKDYDWNKAIAEGMKAMGASYSGKYGFVKTEMYTPVHHEVAPAKQSLGCADCHAPQSVSCARCHTNAAGMNQPEHTRKVYPASAGRFDFKALGYEGDPAVTGGRFYMYLKRGLPPK